MCAELYLLWGTCREMQTLCAAACTCMVLKGQPGEQGWDYKNLFCQYWSDTWEWLQNLLPSFSGYPYRYHLSHSLLQGDEQVLPLYMQMVLTPLLSRRARWHIHCFWWCGTGFITTAMWPCLQSPSYWNCWLRAATPVSQRSSNFYQHLQLVGSVPNTDHDKLWKCAWAVWAGRWAKPMHCRNACSAYAIAWRPKQASVKNLCKGLHWVIPHDMV